MKTAKLNARNKKKGMLSLGNKSVEYVIIYVSALSENTINKKYTQTVLCA